MTCPDNAKLHWMLWELCTIIPKDATPEQQQKTIAMDRANPDYQAVMQTIREHNRTCEKCRKRWNDDRE